MRHDGYPRYFELSGNPFREEFLLGYNLYKTGVDLILDVVPQEFDSTWCGGTGVGTRL